MHLGTKAPVVCMFVQINPISTQISICVQVQYFEVSLQKNIKKKHYRATPLLPFLQEKTKTKTKIKTYILTI